MPSPRSSPAMRPTSPLSPQPARFDMLQPPSPRSTHSRQGNTTRRANTHSLKLPSLPRFHPANYPSAHSSYQNTPEGLVSPQQPMSPRAHSRMYSDAQKQLLMYHRESVAAASRGHSPSGERKPISPRLVPMGSPGPVTPLELEQQGGYLVAGARDNASQGTSQDELVERLIREETRRNGRTTQATGGARPTSR